VDVDGESKACRRGTLRAGVAPGPDPPVSAAGATIIRPPTRRRHHHHHHQLPSDHRTHLQRPRFLARSQFRHPPPYFRVSNQSHFNFSLFLLSSLSICYFQCSLFALVCGNVRFFEIESVAWLGIEHSAAAKPPKHHVGQVRNSNFNLFLSLFFA